ncbi:MAG: tRNA (adenine57-N1/adenine58-N1)-methyltransferase catalytic subunit, partial [Actinomycetota bacterium]|nr:tRNA (adenine57-N1/adenine58-N1)-methyltransferase catalytic subunit [Actinomycetota bacterium]
MTGFEPGERVLLLDDRGRRYLITLQQGQSYHFHRGIVAHDLLIGQPEGVTVRTT